MAAAKKRSEFIERFGMRDLSEALGSRQSAGPTSGQVSSAAAEAVCRALGRLLVRYLQKEESAGKKGSLFGAIEHLDVPIEEILPVARWLERKEYVHVADRPRNGNWKIELLDAAKGLTEERAS